MGLNILFVTPYIPSPVRVRPFALIRELAGRGHRITLVCLAQPAWETQYLPEIAPYCQEIQTVSLKRWQSYLHALASLPSPTPLSVAYCRTRRGNHLVEELAHCGRFDLVHTEFLRAAPLTAGLQGIPKVFDAVDSMALAYRRSISAPYISIPQRLIALVEWSKMRRFEPGTLHRYDRVLVSSPADRQVLYAGGAGQASIIPNGVDFTYFKFNSQARQGKTIAFLGKMSYYVNIASVLWFYHQVFPIIKRENPSVQFTIIGRDPAPPITALAADPSVQVTGSVADVRPHLSSAAVTVCPMVAGAGIQNKMLEAMAVGTPVVATSLACQALNILPGREALVADDPLALAKHILSLLADPGLRGQLADHARRYVEQDHNWSCIGQQLEFIYQDVLH